MKMTPLHYLKGEVKMKTKYKSVVLFITLTVFIFCYTYFIYFISGDELWNYGFSYNIATGLIPYRDFNMIITPFYPMIASIFIKIFGNHLWSIHIFNAITLTTMIMLMQRKSGWKTLLILFLILLLDPLPGYNLFSLFLLIVLITICDKEFKNKDITIALLCSIMFLTKQTIGICMFIPMMYYSKNKLKSLISYIIPILFLLIYLITNQALYQFIDYCFLGMLDFSSSNKQTILLPLEIIICLIITYKLIKSKFKNKELFYILMFQIITIPITDIYHFMLGIIPILYYYLNDKKIQMSLFILLILLCESLFIFNYNQDYYLYEDTNSYLYLRKIDKPVNDNVIATSNYIKEKQDNYEHIYFLDNYSYFVKLNINYPLNKFDLINNGNMGYHGSQKYIEEIDNQCKLSSCLFIISRVQPNDQTNKDILNHVTSVYNKTDEIKQFDIYTN